MLTIFWRRLFYFLSHSEIFCGFIQFWYNLIRDLKWNFNNRNTAHACVNDLKANSVHYSICFVRWSWNLQRGKRFSEMKSLIIKIFSFTTWILSCLFKLVHKLVLRPSQQHGRYWLFSLSFHSLCPASLFFSSFILFSRIDPPWKHGPTQGFFF